MNCLLFALVGRVTKGGWQRALALAILLSGVQAAWAERELSPRKAFDVGPVPAWVDPITPDVGVQAPAGETSKGVHYLLSDMQMRVDGGDRVFYRHVASKALDAQGLETVANLDIRFDPSFQRLTLHAINVRRGTQTIPKLDAAKVKVLQRESDLEALIFDGSMTASVFLDDVRVGDVVEYAYSLRGQNPVFGGRQFGRFEFQWSAPVARAYARLLWPLGREVNMKRLNGAPEPVAQDGATHRDYRWDVRSTKGLRVENDAPSWFDPYVAVQWGEFADWQSVARWAAPLYRLPERPAPKLQAEIARIAAAHPGAEERLLAALRFVQREIRYLGVEVGAGSHAPSAPELVLGRRFGDCKDKALLTVAMLRGLGIDAEPALVNTSQRRGIRDWLPSPGAFNHVVVRAHPVSGEDVWIDATRQPQEGVLEQIVQADYGPALVVDDRSDALVAMAGDKALMRKREMHSVLDATDGLDKPARYTVTTVAIGATADAMRAVLASNSRDDLQRQYLNFYSRYYNGVEVAAPFDVKDDLPANRLTLTEHYRVKDFWQKSEKNHRYEASVETPDVIEQLRQPSGQHRDSPLALAHPVDLTSVTEIRLPERWNGKNEKEGVEDPAFQFERSSTWNGSNVVLRDHYQSRLDHIAAVDVGRYSANLEKARRAVNYSLFRGFDGGAAGGRGGVAWAVLIVGAIAVAGSAMLAWRVYRWDPAPPPLDEPFAPFASGGLGGWLILVGIGIGISIYMLCRTLWQAWPSFTAAGWQALTSPDSASYHPMWAPVLLFSLSVTLVLLVGYVLLAVLFLKRRTSVPRVFIATSIAAVALSMADTALTGSIPSVASTLGANEWMQHGRAILFTMIWSSYFLRSQRVKKTFIERHGRSEAVAPDTPSSSAVPEPA